MPAAKPEPAVAGRADAKPEPTPVAPAVPAEASPRGFRAWLPVLAAIILAPAATWATVQFALLPHLQKKIATGPVHEAEVDGGSETASSAGATAASKKGKAGKSTGAPSYDGFQNVVVNLAGTMGTRYLKTSFIVSGSDPAIASVFESAKPKLHDVTLNVLSSLTLADLEEPGAKNVIREKLVLAYNQALGRRVAEQVYFSDFVIQ